jgi:hypothetical protein
LNPDHKKPAKDLGFQVSASKTFNVSTQVMWEYVLSERGLHTWLGKIDADEFELGNQFITQEGIEAKLSVFVPDCHLRFRWRPAHFEKPSTVELRISNAKGKAKVVFHHTVFFKASQVEELRAYWKAVIAKMSLELSES